MTGSNGKGSTAHFTAAILRSLGLSTGLYTSPHLRHFAERIQVGERLAGDEELLRAWWWIEQRLAASDEKPLAFEVMTALALYVFESVQVEALVAEAGIGGRHDPVRTLPGQVAVLTSLDLEHTEVLGDSIEEIAREKADLADPGGELLVGCLDAGLLAVLRSHCAGRRINLVALEEMAGWTSPRLEGGRMFFDLDLAGEGLPSIRLEGLEMATLGRHQVDNAVLAIAAVARWLSRHSGSGRLGVDLETEPWPRFEVAVRSALAAIVLTGRFERIAHDPEVWIDVGHTPAACRALADTARWRFEGRPIVLVLGVSQNKDAAGIARLLAPLADKIICTRARHRGGDVDRLVDRLKSLGHSPRSIEPLETALRVARDEARHIRAGQDGAVVLVAGGLFLAIEATEILAGRDPATLHFY